MSAGFIYTARRALCSLERLLELNLGQGGYEPSPVQRAICRLLDGVPLRDLETHPDVIQALGGPESMALMPLWTRRLTLLAGVRCGKSLIVALAGIRATQVCEVGRLGPGEVPRVSIVSLTVDNANATFNQHVLGTIEALPIVKALVIGEPAGNAVVLRHPSGRPVEIKVVAGSRAAGSLVSRWCAGAIFDEAPRMLGSDDGAVVNLNDALQNLPARLLPGAQEFLIGSPWAPFGPVYEIVEATWRKPTHRSVVVRARASWMNPAVFTPEAVEDLRINYPDTYLTDELGEFMIPDTGLISPTELQACIRDDLGDDLPPVRRQQYAAAMDPATRGNAWTLVVATYDGKRWSVVMARQWNGSTAAPLSPRAVLAEIKVLLMPYMVDVIVTDQWSADAIRDIARDFDLALVEETLNGPRKTHLFENLRTHICDTIEIDGVSKRRIDFPRNGALIRDLLSVRRRVTQSGSTIELPITTDGRHADYAMAAALALVHPLSAPVPEPTRPDDDDSDEQRLRAEILAKQKKKPRDPFGPIRAGR